MGLLLSAADINEGQSAAVMKALNSRTAISYVSGPPGTGKTKTMATIMSAYDLLLRTSQLPRNFENKVIGVSHSNTGADQLLRAWKKQYLEIHGHLDVEYCRFVNVPFRVTQVDPDKLRTAAMPEDDEDSNLYRQQLEFNMVLPEVVKNLGELTDDLFPVRRLRWAEKQIAIGNEHTDICQSWIDSMSAIKEANSGNAHMTEEMIESHALLEIQITEVYLGECKAIFATCNSSGHPVLASFFRPSLAVIDEASYGNNADVGVTLAAFHQSLVCIVLGGDPMQYGPFASANHMNEARKLIESSRFSNIVEGRDSEEHEVSWLNVQYRMHEDIVELVAQIYANGVASGLSREGLRLITHPSANVLDQKDATLDRMLSPLRPVWQGRRRLAINVDGRDSKWQGGKSLCNHAEAQEVFDMAVRMLNAPAAPENRIKPSDIGILSPYRGQVGLLRSKFRDSQLPQELKSLGLHLVNVTTSRKAQGSEYNYVLLSLCKNSERATVAARSVGFLWHQDQIYVELSRAKTFQIVFGDFRGWVSAIEQGAEWAGFREYAVLRMMVNFFHQKGEIINHCQVGCALETGQPGGCEANSFFL